jgi:hypothetical protein
VDAAQPDGGSERERRPPADDVRKQVQRMRVQPVEQVIADAVFSLLNTAQIKLGRRDARLLIDVSAVAHEHARCYLPDELTSQIDQALGQLRLGQVAAEGNATRPEQPEENDLAQVPVPPSAGPAS